MFQLVVIYQKIQTRKYYKIQEMHKINAAKKSANYQN